MAPSVLVSCSGAVLTSLLCEQLSVARAQVIAHTHLNASATHRPKGKVVGLVCAWEISDMCSSVKNYLMFTYKWLGFLRFLSYYW